MDTAEVSKIIHNMESTGILTAKQMTFCEYTENLLQFQKMINRMVMKEEYVDGMRMEEAIFTLEKLAREKGYSNAPEIRKGIQALKKVSKEIAICMSGKKGENIVARTLEFVQRPNVKIYRNVYVTDGIEETELDTVIVTDSGIMILEIKTVKTDITFSPEGRIIRNNDECYEKMSMGEKMRQKRRLLMARVQKELDARGLDIPVQVDSLIVFSVPKGISVATIPA
ncbi:MAG: nuclease-related domain-containing protein [Eubacteriales bacterium]|nr:nuclease-related domain-containing protein [Eubacteriales bacterium]